MPLTLREALTMVEPLRKSRVVAGEQGLDNVVESVNVMEVPDILDWVRPGELLVTTMYPLHDDAAAIEALVPRLAEDLRRSAARALAAVADARTLLLVSTDFTHYGAAYGFVPFSRDVPAALERLDTGALLKILAGDGDGLRAYGRDTGITMCGLEAAALALDTGLPAGWEGALLGYARSADRDGDYSLSVSYAAVLLADGRPVAEAPA